MRWLLLPSVLLIACDGCPPAELCGDTSDLCLVAEELPEAFLSVRATGDDDVWLVGSETDPNTSGPSVVHFDGEDWNRVDVSEHAGAELWWSHPTAGRVTMVGTEGLIVEYDRDAGTLETFAGPGDDVVFFGVWGAAADDVWAVGGVVASQTPALWHRDADGWSEVAAMPVDAGLLFKVDGTATDDVWVVGEPGLFLHWDGADWTQHDAPDGFDGTKFLTVEVASSDDVFAVGGLGVGAIARWDGAAWTDESPAEGTINGACAGPGEQHAVGASGAVHHHAGGGAWNSELSPLTFRDYHACYVTAGGELWAVGGQISSRPLNDGVVAFRGDRGLPPLD